MLPRFGETMRPALGEALSPCWYVRGPHYVAVTPAEGTTTVSRWFLEDRQRKPIQLGSSIWQEIEIDPGGSVAYPSTVPRASKARGDELLR
jgi:hypothetical protein